MQNGANHLTSNSPYTSKLRIKNFQLQTKLQISKKSEQRNFFARSTILFVAPTYDQQDS